MWLYVMRTRWRPFGGHREDAAAHEVVARELEQRRVPAAAHDRIVDAARLIAREQPRGRLGGGPVVREGVDGRAVRDGQHEHRLRLAAVGVFERDVQRRGRGLLLELDPGGDARDADGAGGPRPHDEGARLRDDDVGGGEEDVALLGRAERGQEKRAEKGVPHDT